MATKTGATVTFSGPIVEWRGPAPYYFVDVPESASPDLRAAVSAAGSRTWGAAKVQVRLDDTEWTTTLMSKEGRYLLPLKDAVRKPRGLGPGDTVTVSVTPQPRPAAAVRKPKPRPRPKAARTEPISTGELTIVPASKAAWTDLQAVFGAGGDPARCWCQRFRMFPKESWSSIGPEGLAARLREQTNCDTKRPTKATPTTGLVAYLGGEPVGWCAVAPRSGHARLLRDFRIPWLDRDEDKNDATVWAVTCFVTRAGYRRLGVSRALARAAVDFARERGARAVEGYPDLVDGGHVGTLRTFTDAGYAVVSRPGNRRAVLRVDF